MHLVSLSILFRTRALDMTEKVLPLTAQIISMVNKPERNHGESSRSRNRVEPSQQHRERSRSYKRNERTKCWYFFKGPSGCKYGRHCRFDHYAKRGEKKSYGNQPSRDVRRRVFYTRSSFASRIEHSERIPSDFVHIKMTIFCETNEGGGYLGIICFIKKTFSFPRHKGSVRIVFCNI